MLESFEPAVLALAERLRRRGERLVTAESCTGGLIAAACTAVAGSSDWLERGHVTYSNEAKTAQLDVAATLIDAHGAVSEPVVEAMARGALVHSEADWSVAVTGIAGPGGGSPGKPVGTVWLAVMQRGGAPHCWRERFDGDRSAVRVQTVHSALRALRATLDAAPATQRPHGAGDDLPPLPAIATGRYRHYKGGEYEVLGVVRHSETLAPLVLYRPLYGDSGTWVRPHGMFLETVVHDGVPQPRFRRMAD